MGLPQFFDVILNKTCFSPEMPDKVGAQNLAINHIAYQIQYQPLEPGFVFLAWFIEIPLDLNYTYLFNK